MCLCEIISSQARFLAWDQAPEKAEKGKKSALAKKKVGERSEPKGSLERGRDVGAPPPFPPPQDTFRLASLADIILSYLTPFFDFSPCCGAWSQANGFLHSHSSCAGFITQLKCSSLLEVIFTIYLTHNSRKFMNK